MRRGELDAASAELSASLAARLAGATGAGRWFDFAVSVYVARGELAPATVVDQLYGAVFFRLLMGHAPLDADFVDQVLAQAMDGMRRRTTRRAPRRRT